MAKKNLTEKNLTFEYLVADSKTVKFQEESTTYTVSDPVSKLDVNRFKITNGTKVLAKFDVNNVVQFIQKLKGQTDSAPQTTTTSPVSTTPAPTGDMKRYIIHGMTADKSVVKFKEDMEKWYLISSQLKSEDLQGRGIVAKAQVDVKIEKVDDEDTVTYINLVAGNPVEEKSASETQTPPSTYSGYDGKSASIERQCAWKTAGETLGKVLTNEVSINDVGVIKIKMRELAEEGIKFIQGK